VGRLEALQDGRLPTPAELLATDSDALRWICLSRVWRLDAPASLADSNAIGERFRPWRTLAALYLY
jgi:3-methyladenine DNA glycosylase/8-oxoguanine DNA glycosylase